MCVAPEWVDLAVELEPLPAGPLASPEVDKSKHVLDLWFKHLGLHQKYIRTS